MFAIFSQKNNQSSLLDFLAQNKLPIKDGAPCHGKKRNQGEG
jgi:hypothetical protein